jgi:hypothetical protein
MMPGKYPKENIQDSEHGKNLKSRKMIGVSGKLRILCNPFLL